MVKTSERQSEWRVERLEVGIKLPYSAECVMVTGSVLIFLHMWAKEEKKTSYQLASETLNTSENGFMRSRNTAADMCQGVSSNPPWTGAAPWRLLRHWHPQSWPQIWGWQSRSCCPMSSGRFGCHRSIGQLSKPGQRRDGTYWFLQPSWPWWTGKKSKG